MIDDDQTAGSQYQYFAFSIILLVLIMVFVSYSIIIIFSEKSLLNIGCALGIQNCEPILHEENISQKTIDCESFELQIRNEIKKSQTCKKDGDCYVNKEFYPGCCPFGCHLIGGIEEKEGDFELLKTEIIKYQSICGLCDYECIPIPQEDDLKCIDGKCEDTRYLSASVAQPTCEGIEDDIKKTLNFLKKCELNDECILDTGTHLGCPFGCYFIRNQNSPPGVIDGLEEKIREYNQECPLCKYKCGRTPKEDEIRCIQNSCQISYNKKIIKADQSENLDEREIAKIFEQKLDAMKNCDIKAYDDLVTKQSLKILRPTCSNMAAEHKCYEGKNYEIKSLENTAVLYFPPYNHSSGWPLFFKRDEEGWRIDFMKMAQGISMHGGGCDTGWGFRNPKTIEFFCSHFPAGECPE